MTFSLMLKNMYIHILLKRIFTFGFFSQNAAVLPLVLVKNGKNMCRFVPLLRKFAKSRKVNVKDCKIIAHLNYP